MILSDKLTPAQSKDYKNNELFIVEGNSVRIVNSAVYAMQILQAEMAGEAETAGLTSEEDILAMVHEMRNEETNA